MNVAKFINESLKSIKNDKYSIYDRLCAIELFLFKAAIEEAAVRPKLFLCIQEIDVRLMGELELAKEQFVERMPGFKPTYFEMIQKCVDAPPVTEEAYTSVVKRLANLRKGLWEELEANYVVIRWDDVLSLEITS